MNDSELTATVRESVSGIHSSTPVDQITSRGRAVRARRRMPVAAGGLAVVAGAALAVTALAPSGHPAPTAAGKAGSVPSVVRLAAWTVAKQANGQIDITIKQLQDPARLQTTLRAYGLPAAVSVPGAPYACRQYPSQKAFSSVVHSRASDGSDFLTITPSALPSGAGVDIADITSKEITHITKNASDKNEVYISAILVKASPACTG
jgi:hypothetical protein